MIPDFGTPPSLARSTNSHESKQEEKYSKENIYLSFLESETPSNLPLPLSKDTFIKSRL